MRATALLNRGGGAFANTSDMRAKVEAALAAAGIEGAIELIDGGEAEARCRAVAQRGDPLLIIGGGDGTVGAAAGAVADTGTALGILPLGTPTYISG